MFQSLCSSLSLGSILISLCQRSIQNTSRHSPGSAAAMFYATFLPLSLERKQHNFLKCIFNLFMGAVLICCLKEDEMRMTCAWHKKQCDLKQFSWVWEEAGVCGREGKFQVLGWIWKKHYVWTEPWNSAFLLFTLPLRSGLSKYIRPWKLSYKAKCMRSYAPGMSGISCVFFFFPLSLFFFPSDLFDLHPCVGCMSLDCRDV